MDQGSHDFMRGILYYAGIDPSEAGSLFTQTDATMKQLTTASETLNEDLKAGWTQGKDLQYRLNHQSAKKEIELRIQDPAVEARYVRASSRSSGFTHFFALKTILHARQQDHPANSYVFLFDEPGIYLHPSGQYDLLAVLDVIGKRNQVIYSTHSLFMINKTFPARHRLIVKDDSGTRIDGKPYIGRWESVIRELGLSLAGTVLFAQHIVLAEGDSDPMLIQAVFQKLVEWDKASVDLNAFAVIATRESKNTDALVRILTEGSGGPSIMVLVDGDEGGKERLRQLTPLLDSHDIETHRLVAGTTIEDYLPGAGRRYVQAVARYVAKIAETHGRTDLSGQEIEKRLLVAAEANDIREDRVTSGIAKWATRKAQELVALESAPSKLGIAREYVELLSEAKADTSKDSQLKRSLGLLRQIQGRWEFRNCKNRKRRLQPTRHRDSGDCDSGSPGGRVLVGRGADPGLGRFALLPASHDSQALCPTPGGAKMEIPRAEDEPMYRVVGIVEFDTCWMFGPPTERAASETPRCSVFWMERSR